MASADVRMPGREGPAPEVAAAPESSASKEDALADKLRGGDYASMCTNLENQAMQLLPNGQMESLSGQDAQALAEKAEKAEKRKKQAAQAAPMVALAEARAAAEAEADDELAALRAARLRQLQNDGKMKQHWVSQGHGVYRQIDDERAFFKDIEPHERTVCLLYRDEDDALHEALAVLAQKHLETMFYKLPEQRAHYMLQMLDLKGLPTLICIRHGKVVEALPPAVLRARPVGRTLARLGLLDDDEVQQAKQDRADRDESDSEEDEAPRRGGRNFFKRA